MTTWENALKAAASAAKKGVVPEAPTLSTHHITVLSKLDLTQKLAMDEYSEEIGKLKDQIRLLEYKIYRRRIPVVICYEGCDAAGKGGNIKRLTENHGNPSPVNFIFQQADLIL